MPEDVNVSRGLSQQQIQQSMMEQAQAEMIENIVGLCVQSTLANLLNSPVGYVWLDKDGNRTSEDKSTGKLPTKAHERDSCYDLYSGEDVTVEPNGRVMVDLGLGVILLPHTDMFILPRSGNAASKGITVLNSPGMIDSNYLGRPLKVIVQNHSDKPVEIKKGDRIAQARFQLRGMDVRFKEFSGDLKELQEKVKRKGGFGSSG